MDNEDQFQLLRRGIRSVRNNIAAKNLPNLLNGPDLTTLSLLMGYGFCSSEDSQPLPLDEDCVYLDSLSRSVIEEGLGTLI